MPKLRMILHVEGSLGLNGFRFSHQFKKMLATVVIVC
jgi:hypothetical protein